MGLRGRVVCDRGPQSSPREWEVRAGEVPIGGGTLFAWLGRCRIHSKNYEHLTESGEAQIQISMIQLILRRLTKAKYRDRFRYKRIRRKAAA